MNQRQRNRLEKLKAALGKRKAPYQGPDYEEGIRQFLAYYKGEAPRPADSPCPPGEDPAYWAEHLREQRIQERRMFEMFGRNKRAAEILIYPPPTPGELRHADEFIEAIRHASLRMIFEEEESGLTFNQWLAEKGLELRERED